MCAKLLQSCPTLCYSLWTAARQAPLFIGFSRQEYWSGLPCPPTGDLPDSGIKPVSLISPALAGRVFTTSATCEAYQRFLPAPEGRDLRIQTSIQGFISSNVGTGGEELCFLFLCSHRLPPPQYGNSGGRGDLCPRGLAVPREIL